LSPTQYDVKVGTSQRDKIKEEYVAVTCDWRKFEIWTSLMM